MLAATQQSWQKYLMQIYICTFLAENAEQGVVLKRSGETKWWSGVGHQTLNYMKRQ